MKIAPKDYKIKDLCFSNFVKEIKGKPVNQEFQRSGIFLQHFYDLFLSLKIESLG